MIIPIELPGYDFIIRFLHSKMIWRRKPKKKKGAEEAAPPAVIDYESFVDASVTVTGQGFTKEKKGKKKIYLKKIDKVEKMAE